MIVAFVLQASVHLSHVLTIFVLYQLPDNDALLVLTKGSYLYLNSKGFCFFFFLVKNLVLHIKKFWREEH